MNYEDEIIKKIEEIPFDVEREVENIFNKEYLRRHNDAGNLWGYSIENHVRKIVENCHQASLIQKDRNLLKYNEELIIEDEKRRLDERTIKFICSEYREGSRLEYYEHTDRLFLKNKNGFATEIDLLCKIEEEIIYGETKYMRKITHDKFAQKFMSPLKEKNFEEKRKFLSRFFSIPVKYWAIVNYEFADFKRKNESCHNPYFKLIEGGHRLVSVNVDENIKNDFYKALVKAIQNIKISGHVLLE